MNSLSLILNEQIPTHSITSGFDPLLDATLSTISQQEIETTACAKRCFENIRNCYVNLIRSQELCLNKKTILNDSNLKRLKESYYHVLQVENEHEFLKEQAGNPTLTQPILELRECLHSLIFQTHKLY